MSVAHPAWAAHAAVYQVNVRQYTPQGTLAAFEPHLPRIAQMLGGQGIVWFMPLQPIGVLHRKGGLGSYYSVSDYTAVNPEFGTLEDVRRVVRRAHDLGLKVIIDWVANHTAWDHAWTEQHPDWYLKDEHGRIHSYVYRASPGSEPEYWTDVVGLDWSRPDVWDAMEQAMRFWVRETGIDGFRCDVAALVPIAFWERVRPLLQAENARKAGTGGPPEVFLLAEAHEPVHHRAAFDATYDWDLFDQLKAIATGQADARALQAWWARRCALYGPEDYRLIYTANHDSNSWQGSCEELFGQGGLQSFKAMATLAMLLPGQPLIYGGQEGVFRKRLAFFEKDPIEWGDRPLQAFYADLLALKARHPALHNGAADAQLQWLDAGTPQVAAFRRVRQGRAVSVWVNLSGQTQPVSSGSEGSWQGSSLEPSPEPSRGATSSVAASSPADFELAPYGCRVQAD